MAKILIVHGISNQFGGEAELHAVWYPALRDGLSRVEYSPLPEPHDCFCPFYGDLFRPPGHLSTQADAQWEDLETVNPDEAELLEQVWRAASATDQKVPAPEEYRDTLVWAPRLAERALNALTRSKYLADYIPLQFFGDLRQVVLYLNDAKIHEKILGRVKARIEPDTRVVVGHSLGSVIAYEALCANPERVLALVTVGSPLGMRNVVFDKLTPPPDPAGRGRWPGRVEYWTNVAATGDIVAAQKQLAPLFGDRVEDLIIDSGWDAHSSPRYLNTAEVGEAIARAFAA
jgi:pimeloyl-ACP methyl ester carboxylesterase